MGKTSLCSIDYYTKISYNVRYKVVGYVQIKIFPLKHTISDFLGSLPLSSNSCIIL